MDIFKKSTLNDYGFELEFSKECKKNKIKSNEKRRLRKLSRARLRRNLKEFYT